VRTLWLLAAAAAAYGQPAISKFAASCGECQAGNDVVLSWSVKGAESVAIDHGVGTVTGDRVTVQPFGAAAVTYTLTAKDAAGAAATATATVKIVDDFATVSQWPSVVRSYGFEGAIPCQAGYVPADPAYSPANPNAGGDGTCDNQTRDTAKAVSGTSSWHMRVPGIAGADPNGSLTINMSPKGEAFGEGQEFYVQWRQYMDEPFVKNVYMNGGRCKANVTLTGVTGSFAAGEKVASEGQPSARGTVAGWDPATGVLVMAPQNEIQWRAGMTVKGPSGSGKLQANNGGGTTPAQCPGDAQQAGMKQLMIDPGDLPPLPAAPEKAIGNCTGPHLVLTLGGQNNAPGMYMGCTQFGGEGAYEGLTGRYFPGSMPQFLPQSGVPCTYDSVKTPGVPSSPPCVGYATGQWMTMQIHVKIGRWYQLAPAGYPKATATFEGGYLKSIDIADPGRDWAPGTTITLNANLDAFVLAREKNGIYRDSDTAVATCPVTKFGTIPSCTIVNRGSGKYADGTFTVRWPLHAGGNFHRDSTIERWQALAGQPSVLVESAPFRDLVNHAPRPQDWSGNMVPKGYDVSPMNYGKLWFTNYQTGRDVNAGPYPTANTWIDNLLVGTKRLPDPGVAVQPPTNLSIVKSAYPAVTLKWERNPDAQGQFRETGYDVERCPGQMYDCIAGERLVKGKTWSVVAKNVGATTYTEKLPQAAQIYTYRVRATGANVSEWSSPVTTAARPPSDLSAYWSGDQVTLSWKQEDDTGEFAVERCAGVFQHRTVTGYSYQPLDSPKCVVTGCDHPSGKCAVEATPFVEVAKGIKGTTNGGTITWTDTTAAPGSMYSYRVRSYTPAGSWREWNANNGSYAAYTAAAIPADGPPKR
jgi:hypothetical protein